MMFDTLQVPVAIKKVKTRHKFFGWPVLRVTLSIQDKTVALISFAKTGRGWYAMPHTDSLGMWFDSSAFEHNATDAMNKLLTGSGLFDDSEPLGIRSTLPLLSYRTEHKVISVISLEGGYDAVMSRLNSNVRRKISRAARYGIVVKHSGTELTDDFYSVYRKTIHKHGSFGMPKDFFRNIEPEEGSLFVAYLNNKPIGSARLSLLMDSAENTAFATLPCYNKLYTSYALHHAMIQHALENGCTIYSFGRSTRGSSVHRFKQQWGAIDKVLYYNSTHPVKAPGNHTLIRKIIRRLPMWVSAAFDRFVAERIF